MNPALLEDQLRTLQAPEGVIQVDVAAPVGEIVQKILEQLHSGRPERHPGSQRAD